MKNLAFGLTPLTPAYGRDYTTAEAARSDLLAGKDFVTPSGRYINKAGLQEAGLGGQGVEVRYDKLRKVVIVKVPDRA